MECQKPYKGFITPKNGMLYAVINIEPEDDPEGKRKPKWFKTGYKERGEKRKADEWLQNKLHELNEVRKQPYNLRDIKEDMMLYDFFKLFLKSKKGVIQDSTIDSYEEIFDNHVKRFFNELNVTLSSANSDVFEDYFDYLYDLGLSGCTALKHYRLMKQAISFGVKKRIIFFNPLDSVEAPKSEGFDADHYTDTEAIDLIKRVKSTELYIPILLATFFGLRRSEVLGVRWSAINFHEKTVRIQRKVIVQKDRKDRKKRILNDTNVMKTKLSKRTLPLIDFVAQELLEEKNAQEERRSVFGRSYCMEYTDHVCVNALGHLIHPDKITASFKPLLKKVKMRTIRFHDLRHTCATLLILNGVPLIEVARYLGHSTARTTEKFYAHLDASVHDRSASMLEELLIENSTQPCIRDIIVRIKDDDIDFDELVEIFRSLEDSKLNRILSAARAAKVPA